MHYRIFQKNKSPTQAGKALKSQWVLSNDAPSHIARDDNTGWSASDDTTKQVVMMFDSCESAVAYATMHQLPYTVEAAPIAHPRRRSYNENFQKPKL
jgi:hypothetical protein